MSGQLYPGGKDLGTQWAGSWVGPRAGMDAEKSFVPAVDRTTVVPSQALYWLSHRGCYVNILAYSNILLPLSFNYQVILRAS